MIRVGIGGWTFEPWRGTFYPDKHPKARELEWASQHLTAIEINGTFYSTQKPATWADWERRTPAGFAFTVKASRFCTNRKLLGEGADSVEKFLGQGLTGLGPKLGAILWQLPATKRFDADDLARFLDLLPGERDGVPLRHALEPRHDSFRDPRLPALLRERGVALVFAEADDYPQFADVTAPFTYARLQCAREEEPAGYAPAALDGWAEAARSWEQGGAPSGFAYAGEASPRGTAGDAFVFFIAGAKVRNPVAAQALIARLG